MSNFPNTSMTLLHQLSAQVTGERESAWARFFGLYEPAIRRFVRNLDQDREPDDVVQDVFLMLVNAIRSGSCRSWQGSFRSFVAIVVRRRLISLYRMDNARCRRAEVNLDEVEPGVPESVTAEIDAKWRLARRQSAIEHVLTKTAISAQSRAVYRAYVEDDQPVEAVAARFGISRDVVYQVKSRVEKMAAAIEAEFGDEDSK